MAQDPLPILDTRASQSVRQLETRIFELETENQILRRANRRLKGDYAYLKEMKHSLEVLPCLLYAVTVYEPEHQRWVICAKDVDNLDQDNQLKKALPYGSHNH